MEPFKGKYEKKLKLLDCVWHLPDVVKSIEAYQEGWDILFREYKNETVLNNVDEIRKRHTIYENGHHRFSQGEYHDAAERFYALVALDPTIKEYWMSLGITMMHLKEYIKAIVCFYSVGVSDSDDPQPLYYAGYCLAEEGKVDSAIRILEVALDLAKEHHVYRETEEVIRSLLNIL